MAKQSQIRPGKKAPQGSNPWLPILGTLAAATPAIAVGLLGAHVHVLALVHVLVRVEPWPVGRWLPLCAPGALPTRR